MAAGRAHRRAASRTPAALRRRTRRLRDRGRRPGRSCARASLPCRDEPRADHRSGSPSWSSSCSPRRSAGSDPGIARLVRRLPRASTSSSCRRTARSRSRDAEYVVVAVRLPRARRVVISSLFARAAERAEAAEEREARAPDAAGAQPRPRRAAVRARRRTGALLERRGRAVRVRRRGAVRARCRGEGLVERLVGRRRAGGALPVVEPGRPGPRARAAAAVASVVATSG